MRAPRPLPDEEARLLSLSEYGFEGKAGEPSLDPIVALATRMFDAPMAVVNLINREHVFLAAAAGMDRDLDPDLARRDISFCAHTITHTEPMVVTDASLDPRDLHPRIGKRFAGRHRRQLGAGDRLLSGR